MFLSFNSYPLVPLIWVATAPQMRGEGRLQLQLPLAASGISEYIADLRPEYRLAKNS